MKKRNCMVIFLILLCLLTACSSGSTEDGTNQSNDNASTDYQRGFMRGFGNAMAETPDGYYIFYKNMSMNDYLCFMDKEMKEYHFLCGKPECLHDQEDMENKQRCDAYFPKSNAVNYYNGKLYVAAEDSQNINKTVYSIYEIDVDGSNRKKVYEGEGEIHSFCIHKGEMILYEKKYIEDKLNPVISITRFPVENPEKKEILYENDNYENGIINFFECHQNYCYFQLSFYTSEGSENHAIIINLETKEVKDCYEFANAGLVVGNDRIYCRNFIERDNENGTWKDEYYECSLDGEIKKQITKDDFGALEKGAVILRADENYVYMGDVVVGGNAVSEEEAKFYVYNYDGTLEATIARKNPATELLQGNDSFFFIIELVIDTEVGNTEVVFYRIDKANIGGGKELIPEEFLRW